MYPLEFPSFDLRFDWIGIKLRWQDWIKKAIQLHPKNGSCLHLEDSMSVLKCLWVAIFKVAEWENLAKHTPKYCCPSAHRFGWVDCGQAFWGSAALNSWKWCSGLLLMWVLVGMCHKSEMFSGCFTVTGKDHEIFSYEYLTWKHQTWQVETWLQLVEATCATWLELWGISLGSDFLGADFLCNWKFWDWTNYHAIFSICFGEVDFGSFPSHTLQIPSVGFPTHGTNRIYSSWRGAWWFS